jgi:hypothetical protein
MRLFALALVLLAVPQDPADKVRALVEKLASDDVAERDKVAGELMKLGAPALPALRAHEAKAVGQSKAVLQGVIQRIEGAVRLDKLLGSAPVVTLNLKDAKVEAAIAELAAQSGLAISGFFVEDSMRVTYACERVPVWKAIDDLCRAQGGVAPAYSQNSIIIEGGKERGTPVTLHKSLGIHFAPPLRRDGALRLQAYLTYPPGMPVWTAALEFDELTDDLGTAYEKKSEAVDPFLEELFSGQGPPDQFCSKFQHRSAAEVPDKAVRLKRVRGAITAKVAMEFKMILKVAQPLKGETAAEEGGYKLAITPKRKDEAVQFRINVEAHPEGDLDLMGGLFSRDTKKVFGCRDDQGNLHLARVKSSFMDESDHVTVTARLPKGREVVSLELMEITEFAEIRIPFDYADVPLKAIEERSKD